MKLSRNFLSAAKSLTGLLLLSCIAAGAQAAAKLTLEGEATGVKYESDNGVRISVIDWSGDSQRMAVEDAWRLYQENDDLDAFLATVEEQDTRGYIFTAAATGYRIKYAWEEETDGGRMMHFLVTPGLKTRNPYLWETPNNNSPAFTMVQVYLDNETGVAKTSLNGEIVANEEGKLALDRFDSLNTFATMQDSTPYYLTNR